MVLTEEASIFILLIIVLLVVSICSDYCNNPFQAPLFVEEIDISGKKTPDYDDAIDTWINSQGYYSIEEHERELQQWKQSASNKLETMKMYRKHREQQYMEAMQKGSVYKFVFVRMQTRYQQQNYVRTSYQVKQVVQVYACDYKYLSDRCEQLRDIGFECTLKQYHSQNQRKLMTRQLRREVMIRDRYTCQECGKYMPDEVGLQIDHIIPVSKGGKTVMSNLQVLCSKCNGRKSDRV